jgi:hypothetical protein
MQLYEAKMNDEIKKTFDAASLMSTLNNQKQILYEELNQSLLYYHNGAVFTVNLILLSFIGNYCTMQKDSVVLLDDNQMPVLIDDLSKFYRSILSVYTEATNRYYYEYNKVTNPKNIVSIINND